MRAQYRTRRWAARPGGDKRAARRLAAHRGTSTREMPRRLGAFAVALSFAVLVAQPAAASDAQMESDSKNIAVGVCTFAGGTAMMDHVLNADGSLASIQTTCLGGQADGQVCTATQSSFDCTFPFTNPPTHPRPPSRVSDPARVLLRAPSIPPVRSHSRRRCHRPSVQMGQQTRPPRIRNRTRARSSTRAVSDTSPSCQDTRVPSRLQTRPQGTSRLRSLDYRFVDLSHARSTISRRDMIPGGEIDGHHLPTHRRADHSHRTPFRGGWSSRDAPDA
jgi:hypothetical protein